MAKPLSPEALAALRTNLERELKDIGARVEGVADDPEQLRIVTAQYEQRVGHLKERLAKLPAAPA